MTRDERDYTDPATEPFGVLTGLRPSAGALVGEGRRRRAFPGRTRNRNTTSPSTVRGAAAAVRTETASHPTAAEQLVIERLNAAEQLFIGAARFEEDRNAAGE